MPRPRTFPRRFAAAAPLAALLAAGPAALAAPPAALDGVPEGRLKTALAAELAILDARRAPAPAPTPAPAEAPADPVAAPAEPVAGPVRASAGTTAPPPGADRRADPPGWVDPFADGGEEGETDAEADADLNLAFDATAADLADAAPPTAARPSAVAPEAPAAPPQARVSLGDLTGEAPAAGPGEPAADGNAATEPIAAEPSAGERLAAAALTPGFGGFCPVAVRDAAELVDADPAVHHDHGGVRYHFATAAARVAFRADPGRYVPAVGGQDVVLRSEEGFRAAGRAELAVLYRGRLFLFRSAATRAAFATDPLRFVDAE